MADLYETQPQGPHHLQEEDKQHHQPSSKGSEPTVCSGKACFQLQGYEVARFRSLSTSPLPTVEGPEGLLPFFFRFFL